MAEPAYLICMSTASCSQPPGCVIRKCSKCGTTVWVAESGQRQLMLIPTLQIVCQVEGRIMMKADVRPHVSPAVGALAELEEWAGPEMAAKARRAIGEINRSNRRQRRADRHRR